MSDIMPNELKWWWGCEKPKYDTITTTESLSCSTATNITTRRAYREEVKPYCRRGRTIPSVRTHCTLKPCSWVKGCSPGRGLNGSYLLGEKGVSTGRRGRRLA